MFQLVNNTIKFIGKRLICTLLFCIFYHPIKSVCLTTESGPLTIIKGSIPELNDKDTVFLRRYNYQFILGGIGNENQSYCIVKNNSFFFNVKLANQVERCEIIFPERLSNLSWANGIIETGRDLSIGVKNNQLHFSGPGAALVFYNNLLDSVYRTYAAHIDWQGKLMEKNTGIVKAAIDKILDADKESIKYASDGFSALRLSKVASLLTVLYSIANNNGEDAKAFMRKTDRDLSKNYLQLLLNNKNTVEIPSTAFAGLVSSRYTCLSDYQHDSDLQQYITYLKDNFKDPLFSQLVASFLFDRRNSDKLTPDFVNKAIAGVDIKPYESLLNSITKSAPGVTMPEFTLYDTTANKVSLSKFKGSVLLLDFWFTGCLACSKAHKIVDSVLKKFEGQPVKLISISNDQDPNIWLKSIYSNLYTSIDDINLSPGKEGESHPLFRFFEIIGYPTFIIIDKDGRIIGSPLLPNIDKGKDLSSKLLIALGETQ